MSEQTKTAVVHFSGDDLFIGITPSGHGVSIDTNRDRNAAPSPVELLLVALGSCTGIDVIGILQKKREKVVEYRIEITGERRQDHPRAFTRMDVRHIIKGKDVSEKAVLQAIELSDQKYCSVAATLRPTVEIISTYEIIEVEEHEVV